MWVKEFTCDENKNISFVVTEEEDKLGINYRWISDFVKEKSWSTVDLFPPSIYKVKSLANNEEGKDLEGERKGELSGTRQVFLEKRG